MDQNLINLVFGSFGLLLGAVIKALWDALKDLKLADESIVKKIGQIEVLVAGEYATRDHVEKIFRDLGEALFKKLDKIEDKLDGKVDKH
jgi:hypothetical protein